VDIIRRNAVSKDYPTHYVTSLTFFVVDKLWHVRIAANIKMQKTCTLVQVLAISERSFN